MLTQGSADEMVTTDNVTVARNLESIIGSKDEATPEEAFVQVYGEVRRNPQRGETNVCCCSSPASRQVAAVFQSAKAFVRSKMYNPSPIYSQSGEGENVVYATCTTQGYRGYQEDRSIATEVFRHMRDAPVHKRNNQQNRQRDGGFSFSSDYTQVEDNEDEQSRKGSNVSIESLQSGTDEMHVFAVLDGHGISMDGHTVSSFCSRHVVNLLLHNMVNDYRPATHRSNRSKDPTSFSEQVSVKSTSNIGLDAEPHVEEESDDEAETSNRKSSELTRIGRSHTNASSEDSSYCSTSRSGTSWPPKYTKNNCAAIFDCLDSFPRLTHALFRTCLELDLRVAQTIPRMAAANGTTLTMVLIRGEQIVFVNVGDSRTVLSSVNSNEGVLFETVDHKPNDEAERKRIYAASSFVQHGRVEGDLAISRTFGDCMYKPAGRPPHLCPVSCEPTISVIHGVELQNGRRAFLIVASDGLWDVFSSDEATEFVRNSLVDAFLPRRKSSLQRNKKKESSSRASTTAKFSQSSTAKTEPVKREYGPLLEQIGKDLIFEAMVHRGSSDNITVQIIGFRDSLDQLSRDAERTAR